MEENTEKKETVEERKENAETEVEKETREENEKITSSETVETDGNPSETAKEETSDHDDPNKRQDMKKAQSKPEKKHSGKGKIVMKVLGAFAIVFVAAFGGTYAAISWLDSKFEKEAGNPFDSYGDMPFDYEEFNGNSSDGYSSKTNSNSAGLGIYIRSDSDKAEIYSFTDDSLADDAGMEIGDVITAVDGNAVSSYDDVVEQLKDKKPGDKVKITYERNGEEKEADVELIDRSSSASQDSPFSSQKGQMMQ